MNKLIDLESLHYFSQAMYQKSKDSFANKSDLEAVAASLLTHTHDQLYVNKTTGGTFEGPVTFNGDVSVSNVFPGSDTNSIGTVLTPFNAVFADTLYENGKRLDEKYMGLHKSTADLTDAKYDQNTWYPCVSTTAIGRKGLHRIMCSTQLNGSKPSWATHNNGFTCICDVLQIAGGWGVAAGLGICLNYQCRHVSDNKNPCGYWHLDHSSKTCFWLRGGGRYDMYTQNGTGWDIYTETVTIAEQTIWPETSCPGARIERSGIYANIHGNIDQHMYLANNVSLKGRSTTGAEYDICGIDTNNEIYLGWNNQTNISVKNSMYCNKPLKVYTNDGNGDGNGDTNIGYYDTTNQYYCHYFRGKGFVAIDNKQSIQVSCNWMKLGGKRFTISADAPSSPATGDIWIDI